MRDFVRTVVLAVCLLPVCSLSTQAGDAAAGRRKATMCQTCHGLDGISKQPEAPNLAGQVESYLIKSLTDFKDGVRANEKMSVVAPTLNEIDIADLAAYYASIKIAVIPAQ
jgi:cytochrome c553